MRARTIIVSFHIFKVFKVATIFNKNLGHDAYGVKQSPCSAPSRCILVPFEWYGHPKNYTQKSSCNTFSIYISHKNLIKYSLEIVKK